MQKIFSLNLAFFCTWCSELNRVYIFNVTKYVLIGLINSTVKTCSFCFFLQFCQDIANHKCTCMKWSQYVRVSCLHIPGVTIFPPTRHESQIWLLWYCAGWLVTNIYVLSLAMYTHLSLLHKKLVKTYTSKSCRNNQVISLGLNCEAVTFLRNYPQIANWNRMECLTQGNLDMY